MKSEQLLKSLQSLRDDSAKMAHLRRWWSPATRHYAYPILAGVGGAHAIDDSATAIVAALFASHPEHSDQAKNIGYTCRRIAGDKLDTFEPHFKRLLAASHLELELAPQLLRIAKRAKNKGKAISIDYLELHKNLSRWNYSSNEQIKKAWAMQFWGAPTEDQLDIPAE